MNKYTDLTIILYCTASPAPEQLNKYVEACTQLIIVCPDEPGTLDISGNIAIVSHKPEEGKVSCLNRAVWQAEGAFTLWLEQGESIPALPNLIQNTFYAARLSNEQAKGPVHNWQVRLFPATHCEEPCFGGFEIPDIQTTARKLNWQQSDHFLTIVRETPLIASEAISKEVMQDETSIMLPFWRGIHAAENGNFKTAIAGFKELLKSDTLFFWNRLAALNSSANALMEMQRAEEAKTMAEQSLQLSASQWAPYLTLHQYYNLNGQWDLAYETLNEYRAASKMSSAANWDTYLPESQAAFLMAEIASGCGQHQRAYTHYQEFFRFNDGSISRPVLEKLFIYAIELDDLPQAIAYFKALFSNDLAEVLSENKSARVLEALSMFTDKGWYDFPSCVYRQLVLNHPEDDAIRHGCIRTLVKNNEIEKAQALL